MGSRNRDGAVDYRGADRQLGAAFVVVGHDRVDTEPCRLGDFVNRGDSGVDCDQQLLVLSGERAYRVEVDSVPLAYPTGNIIRDVS